MTDGDVASFQLVPDGSAGDWSIIYRSALLSPLSVKSMNMTRLLSRSGELLEPEKVGFVFFIIYKYGTFSLIW